jgi:hypothetical protein
MMSRVQKGMVAGFAATLAVSVLEVVNMVAGPWVETFPSFLAAMLGMPDNPAVGWAVHFAMGTLVLGSAFGILCPRLPTDTPETKGILFAVGAWTVLIVAVFLFGDPRVFRSFGGFGIVAWMLATHAVFGIVLGNIYARLVAREKRAMRDMAGAAPAH